LISALFDDTGAMDKGSAYLFDTTTGNLLQIINNPARAKNVKKSKIYPKPFGFFGN
jgi:hypothetical protein